MTFFNGNATKTNPDKCHLLITTNEEIKFLLGERKYKIEKVKSCLESPLIINCLLLTMYIKSVIKLVKNLTHWMIIKFYELRKTKNNSHSQFGYYPLIWMFHNRTLNNKINRIHEQALRIVYHDKTSNFTEILQKDNAVSVYQRNLQVPATEIYKVKMGLAQQLVKELFPLSTHRYNLRSIYEFKLENLKTVHYGTESLSFLGPRIWQLALLETESSYSLEEFS